MNVYKIVCPSPRGTIAAEERTVRSDVSSQKIGPYHLHSRLKFGGEREQSRITAEFSPTAAAARDQLTRKEHSERRNQIA
ncbi:hypothetical protein TNIN_455601 [Trichonephila inaurata madagascariensis]|uniref:Uncharacterized protein n=1 Tax=Trichonephila inaurata madagascariensis TaxID=2747483 RepID=A0A8X6WR34_9ARAC|nr:hypothetical protein TNIN_455601 [Trichonephila inaurata madagascariensis]